MRVPAKIRPGIGVAILAAATAACVSGKSGVEIRPIGLAPSGASASTTGELADGQAQLALGNVGLALESFRKALRQQPASVDSLVGIARCYDAMGRTDLSRRYFEEALAIAPGNVTTLGALAASLAGQGRAEEARKVRDEIALRSLGPGSTVSWTVEDKAPATPVEAAASITVDLPRAVAGPSAATGQAPAKTSAVQRVRLERLSLGEVALVTTPRPYWPTPAIRAEAAPTASPPDRVRLLNAARRQRLAARSREKLAGVGWHSIIIGNAVRTRARSIVYYPLGSRAAAQQLAAKLRIDAIEPTVGAEMLVLLGRDIAG